MSAEILDSCSAHISLRGIRSISLHLFLINCMCMVLKNVFYVQGNNLKVSCLRSRQKRLNKIKTGGDY